MILYSLGIYIYVHVNINKYIFTRHVYMCFYTYTQILMPSACVYMCLYTYIHSLGMFLCVYSHIICQVNVYIHVGYISVYIYTLYACTRNMDMCIYTHIHMTSAYVYVHLYLPSACACLYKCMFTWIYMCIYTRNHVHT